MYTDKFNMLHKIKFNVQVIDNDPSAGSPTETLLRLLLPLDNLVCKFLKNTTIFQEDRCYSNPLTNSSNR